MRIFMVIFLFSIVFQAHSKSELGFLKYNRSVTLHYGIYSPDNNDIKGDVLYFHGYGDRFTGHTKLFNKLNEGGFRVIAFDFPSHGKTLSPFFGDLDHQGFKSLSKMGQFVYNTKIKNKKNLFLAGWSTGGLVAIRTIQKNWNNIAHKVKGLLLYAPGVSVYPCVGNAFCHITNDTLNHNVALDERPIKPKTPLTRPAFASKLLLNAHNSWKSNLRDIPTIVFAADTEEDEYVKGDKLIKWIKKQRIDFEQNIKAQYCPGAAHELDNELDRLAGSQVRHNSLAFLSNLAGNAINFQNGNCYNF